MQILSLPRQLNQRAATLLVVAVLIAATLLTNAFRIQIVEGQTNLKLSGITNRSTDRIAAPRGLIYDSKGRELVTNDASFSVYVLPSELDQKKVPELLKTVAELLGANAADLQARYDRSAFNSKKEVVGERVTLINNLDYQKFLANYNALKDLQHVYVGNEPKRNYHNANNLAHLMGYLGDITKEELDARQDLWNRARVGKTGLEKSYDSTLRGQDGMQITEKSGDNFSQSWTPQSYKSGDNIYLTIDLDWQDHLYTYLQKYTDEQNAYGGAAIIMEADTGKLKAMVNYPTYDANLFSSGLTQAQFDALLKDPRSPLLNRAISMQIPPGSIYKIVMAAALQQEGVITKNTDFKSGCFKLTDDYQLCEADAKNYGTLNMTQALARSSNPYFCQATVGLATKYKSDQTAIRKLDEYFEAFGLGKLSGIELAGEQPGTIPTPELKQRLQGDSWYLADLCNTAIGQGLVSTTPIQIAIATSAVINGGKVLQPRLVDKFESADKRVTEPQMPASKTNLLVAQEYLNNIKEGMRQSVDYGTAKGLKGLPGNPIAKTGSSEAAFKVPEGGSVPKDCILAKDGFRTCAHSWVAGSFNKDGKDYVFVVAIQFGGRGYKSVPVIGDFLKCVHSDFKEC